MKILFLGPSESPLIAWLNSVGEEVVSTTEPIGLAEIQGYSPDFIVSYGYRHIIKRDVLDNYKNKVINLHVSYLPWNRGADPNFWSFIENTPKGVTIHYIDEGIDTGDIIAQKTVSFSRNETLQTSYNQLQNEIQALFKEIWFEFRAGKCDREKQEGEGTKHKIKEKNKLLHLLTTGWDTPIAVLEEYTNITQFDAKLKEISNRES
jgi:methionyl-tRNA formyltransferase